MTVERRLQNNVAEILLDEERMADLVNYLLDITNLTTHLAAFRDSLSTETVRKSLDEQIKALIERAELVGRFAETLRVDGRVRLMPAQESVLRHGPTGYKCTLVHFKDHSASITQSPERSEVIFDNDIIADLTDRLTDESEKFAVLGLRMGFNLLEFVNIR